MDNNSNYEYINNLYDKLSYYDMYGSSVALYIILTLIVFYVYTYFSVMQVKEEIVDDWSNQRCNPKYIPFAGYLTHPEGTTAFEYTNENFQYCIQNILTDVTGKAVQPFEYMINSVLNMLNVLGESTQKVRQFIDLLRQRIRKFAEDVLHRIMNVMVPLQTIMIALMDAFNKMEGTMTAGLYTMLGTYYTLQSLMGAIVELIIKMLLVLVIIIVGLWIMPFSWPAAAASSAVFLAISIPLSIIVIVMTEVLHIKASGIPKLRCFDKNTLLLMNNGSYKKIIDVDVGEVLHNCSTITAKMELDASNLQMFTLYDVIVSESHTVKYNDVWIKVADHPDAVKIETYNEPFIYCLNTDTKEIIINETIFTDWDEIYDDELEKVINAIPQNLFTKDIKIQKQNIHKYLDEGFEEDTIIYLYNGSKKQIKDVRVGDITSTRGIVYGIVEVLNDNILGNMDNNNETKLYHLLVSNKFFETKGKIIRDYNDKIDYIYLKKII